jgi:hypothetical protein
MWARDVFSLTSMLRIVCSPASFLSSRNHFHFLKIGEYAHSRQRQQLIYRWTDNLASIEAFATRLCTTLPPEIAGDASFDGQDYDWEIVVSLRSHRAEGLGFACLEG